MKNLYLIGLLSFIFPVIAMGQNAGYEGSKVHVQNLIMK